MSALTSTIQNYIYPADKFSKPKKNYIKENMKLIKKMQIEPKEKYNALRPVLKRQTKKGEEEKFPLSAALSPNDKIFSKPVKEIRLPPKEDSKEQGCQTSSNDLDGGKVRFPKNRPATPEPPNGKRHMSLQVDPINDLVFKSSDPVSVIAPSCLPVKGDGKIDFVRLNMVIAPKKKQQVGKNDPSKPPPTYQRGVIPKYLRESKKQQIEEVQEKGLVELIDELDEHNYLLVPEEEKRERLREIRLAYAQLVTELNSLPFRSDSPKILAKREQIESTLHKLEDGIKLFSREKLYLKSG